MMGRPKTSFSLLRPSSFYFVENTANPSGPAPTKVPRQVRKIWQRSCETRTCIVHSRTLQCQRMLSGSEGRFQNKRSNRSKIWIIQDNYALKTALQSSMAQVGTHTWAAPLLNLACRCMEMLCCLSNRYCTFQPLDTFCYHRGPQDEVAKSSGWNTPTGANRSLH